MGLCLAGETRRGRGHEESEKRGFELSFFGRWSVLDARAKQATARNNWQTILEQQKKKTIPELSSYGKTPSLKSLDQSHTDDRH